MTIGKEIALTRCRANDRAREMKVVYAPGGMIYDDMQHANISKSSCNVLDLAVSQSPRALGLTVADRRGLSGVLLSACIKGYRYSAIASWDFAIYKPV